MKRTQLKPFFYLFLFLMFLLSLSDQFSQKLQGAAVSIMAPIRGTKEKEVSQKRALQLENERLKTQIETLKEWVISEGRREQELSRLEHLHARGGGDEGYFHRRSEELAKQIELQMKAVPAKVVFREPVSWSSAVWLNVGTRDNEALGVEVVAVDSPVVVGSALVGVVEAVKRTQCRVRLITDSGLVPAVRAVRGSEQRRVFRDQLIALKSTLDIQEALEGISEEEKGLLKAIEQIELKWGAESSSAYLAKGELAGSSSPLWRSRGNFLKGVGFNYDFSDVEGKARQVRKGEGAELSLLSEGDILVTTGFDGVFPPGLHVARVVEVGHLREGASSYELVAKPIAPNLDHLETVFVLPPLNYAE